MTVLGEGDGVLRLSEAVPHPMFARQVSTSIVRISRILSGPLL